VKRLPIVYIRGYAGPTTGINAQVDDPFYGFNKGATHVRVGGSGEPAFYQFEGPMLRLMIDHQYQLLVQGDQHAYLENSQDGTVDADSIWVYRFYDQAATTFAAPPRRPFFERIFTDIGRHFTADGFNIESAAAGLYDLIKLIQRKIKADDKRVVLVAHSMGGLIARCMMQKVAVEKDDPAKNLVARLFTYGTPHGGIVFQTGVLNWFEDVVGPAGSDIFAPEKMYGYLTPGHKFGDKAPRDWDPQSIPPDVFDINDVFCLIGTDPKDYGVSKAVVGPKSDGLVRIEHAYVRNAHRAFVFKSHSGSYGEVNSEEGYQNLRRFLFGRWQVRVDLAGLPTFSDVKDAQPAVFWQADMRLSVRGLPVVLSEQRADQYTPIPAQRRTPAAQRQPRPSGAAADHVSVRPDHRSGRHARPERKSCGQAPGPGPLQPDPAGREADPARQQLRLQRAPRTGPRLGRYGDLRRGARHYPRLPAGLGGLEQRGQRGGDRPSRSHHP